MQHECMYNGCHVLVGLLLPPVCHILRSVWAAAHEHLTTLWAGRAESRPKGLQRQSGIAKAACASWVQSFALARLRHVQAAGYHTIERRGVAATPSPLSSYRICPQEPGSSQNVVPSNRSGWSQEGCERLTQTGLPSTKAVMDLPSVSSPPEGLPTGCFHSAGIQVFSLPQSNAFIGRKA